MPGWATRKTAEEIRRLVRLGKAREGGQLPSERDLANALQVSRATVRAALRILRDEGERVWYSKRGASGRTTTSPDALSFPKTRMSCLPIQRIFSNIIKSCHQVNGLGVHSRIIGPSKQILPADIGSNFL